MKLSSSLLACSRGFEYDSIELMKIFKLLELDRKNLNQEALSLNLGDQFLFQNNRLFKKIRQLSLKAGYQYSADFDSEYTALPLSQLNQIYSKKIIPYFDNVTVLTEIEKKIPQTTDWDEVTDNLKRNHVFHESCHAVARSMSEFELARYQSDTDQVLKILIEESFANSCELLGLADVDQAAHRLFYEAQSYIFMLDQRNLILELIRDFEFDFVFKWMIFSYLFSNFQKNKIEEFEMNRILKMLLKPHDARQKLITEAKQIKKLRVLSKIAFELNPRFRMVTTGFYLRLCGFNKESCNFNFLKTIEEKIEFQTLIQKLASSLVNQ